MQGRSGRIILNHVKWRWSFSGSSRRMSSSFKKKKLPDKHVKFSSALCKDTQKSICNSSIPFLFVELSAVQSECSVEQRSSRTKQQQLVLSRTRLLQHSVCCFLSGCGYGSPTQNLIPRQMCCSSGQGWE